MNLKKARNEYAMTETSFVYEFQAETSIGGIRE